MSASTMVERVARAIVADRAEPWDDLNDDERRSWAETARAAIEAMMEPDEAQIKCGLMAIWQFTHWADDGVDIEPGAAREVWVDMLSEALNRHEPVDGQS